jgi:hypothetical protein
MLDGLALFLAVAGTHADAGISSVVGYLLLVFLLFSLFMLLLARMLLQVFLIFFGPTVTGIQDLVLSA